MADDLKKFLALESIENQIVDFAFSQKNNKIYSTHNNSEIMEKWYHNRSWKKLDTKKMPDKMVSAIIMVDDYLSPVVENYFKDKNKMAVHKWEMLSGEYLRVFEIFDSNYTKATMVEHMSNHYNIAKKNIHIFGDGRNDIPMFIWGQNTYAMANADDGLKLVASETLKFDNADNGVGRKIEEILEANK